MVLNGAGLTSEQLITLKRAVDHVVRVAAGKAGDEIKGIAVAFSGDGAARPAAAPGGVRATASAAPAAQTGREAEGSSLAE